MSWLGWIWDLLKYIFGSRDSNTAEREAGSAIGQGQDAKQTLGVITDAKSAQDAESIKLATDPGELRKHDKFERPGG